MADLQRNVIKEEAREGTVISDGKELRNFDESYREKYQTNVLPAIKQALKDDWLNVRLEKSMFPQRNWLCTGHRGCSWSWSPDPNFFVPSCLSLALASAPPPICGRGCLPLSSLCLPSVSSHEVPSYLHRDVLSFTSYLSRFFFRLSKSYFPPVYSSFQSHVFSWIPTSLFPLTQQAGRKTCRGWERWEGGVLYMLKKFEVKRGGTFWDWLLIEDWL